MDTLVFNKMVIGPYEVGELLGQGGMGMVYRAYQPSLERYVALKVLNRTAKSSAIFDQRFAREVSIAASLEHPHIVPVYDYGSTDDVRYVAMRLLTGGSLADRLAVRRDLNQPYTAEEVDQILKPIASAIDFAHKKGIIHRDIKPSNIMFDEHDRPYLVDFGIARLMDTNSGMTQTGFALGTPAYMPPEQWMGKEATSPSDVYALGAVTFEMLTLHPPFEASNPFALMQKHVQQPAPIVNDLRPDLPTQVGMAVRQALQKQETDRFATAGSFAEAFAQATQGQTSPLFTIDFDYPNASLTNTKAGSAKTVNLKKRYQRRRPWAAAILLIGMLACGASAFLMRESMGLVPPVQLQLSATPDATMTATTGSSPSPQPSATSTTTPANTLLPNLGSTLDMTASPIATVGDKFAIGRPTRPGPHAPSVTITATTTPSSAQPTSASEAVGQPATSTVTPTSSPTSTPTVPSPTPTATKVPPTATRLPATTTKSPPTAIPPTPVPPTPVPPTAEPAPADNGNSGGNSGNGGGNGNSGSNGNAGGNGNGNSGSNGNGGGNGGGNGNGNGNG